MLTPYDTPNILRRYSVIAVILLNIYTRSDAEDRVAAKAQSYVEENDRITVESYYILWDKDWGEKWSTSIEGIYNTISGATPTGSLDPNTGQPTYSVLDDHRGAFIFNVDRYLGDWTITGNFNFSEETDYESVGGAVTVAKDFNQKNTNISLGYGYLADRVQPNGPGFNSFRPQDKRIKDLVFGWTQVVDPYTLFSFNLAYSRNEGYLNDPYKSISFTQTIPFVGTIYLPELENRPRERDRFIVTAQVNRRFEKLMGTAQGSYRFSTDSFGIDTHTVSFAWFQDITDWLIIQPYGRYYRQSAADFYFHVLDNPGFNPSSVPPGAEPYFSADHRLSELETLTGGLKAIFTIRDNITLDIAYERYVMSGLDGVTPDEVYSKANTVTIGASFRF